MFPEIVNEARSQFNENDKVNEPRSQCGFLSWTHYRILTQVEDSAARSEDGKLHPTAVGLLMFGEEYKRVEDTPVHKAIREALVNCLVNADYYMPQGVVSRISIRYGKIRAGKCRL